MRYMPINSGSVLHGIWHDLRLRELKDKLEEMHVMYELSHKKGASMSNKKFVSFLDLTLSRNERGLVVVAGLPTGDSTLNVVPPIGSVQTDKIGFNDMSIDERCALWALIYGQSYNERPTFKPTSEAFDPKNLGMRTRDMLMTANTNLNGRYTVDKHFSCRLKKAEK